MKWEEKMVPPLPMDLNERLDNIEARLLFIERWIMALVDSIAEEECEEVVVFEPEIDVFRDKSKDN